MPLNCSRTNTEDDKFYVMRIYPYKKMGIRGRNDLDQDRNHRA